MTPAFLSACQAQANAATLPRPQCCCSGFNMQLTSDAARQSTADLLTGWLHSSVPISESQNCTFPAESALTIVPSERKSMSHTTTGNRLRDPLKHRSTRIRWTAWPAKEAPGSLRVCLASAGNSHPKPSRPLQGLKESPFAQMLTGRYGEGHQRGTSRCTSACPGFLLLLK